MKMIESAIIGLADEVTMNPDIVTSNAIRYTKYLMAHKEETQDVDAIESMIHEISQYGKWQQRIYLLSVLTYYSRNNKYIIEMIDYINEHFDDISLASLNFIRNQIEVIAFKYSSMTSKEISIKKWKLYDRIMDKYVSFFTDELEASIEPVNDDLVIVFTEQLIGTEHGPTKSALDRCKILIEQMKKKVILINTAEMLSAVGMVPFYEAQGGVYNKDLLTRELIEWKGVSVPYVQLKNNMPESNDVRDIINVIKNLKPSFCISIGGGSVVVSLISKIMPVLTVGMVPSNIIPTLGWFQTYSKDISSEDIELLDAVGRDESHIIKAVFGSSIVSIQEERTKEMIGFKNTDFVILLVGSRIKNETDDIFWNMISKCNVPDLQVMILGINQDEADKCIERFDELQGKVHGLGMMDDPLGYMCAADIYVNPNRRGGGTSCVEAMSLGVPVVSLDYGDVAVNVGKEFLADSYEEMCTEIEKYCVDKVYYKQQSEKAKMRAERLLNAEEDFVNVVNEFVERIKY